MELAVAHGYRSATEKGYAEQRRRAHGGTGTSRVSPAAAQKGWADLARDWGKLTSGAGVATSNGHERPG
jgi:hypothetical protein